MRCISVSDSMDAFRTTPAGLPPPGSLANADKRSTSAVRSNSAEEVVERGVLMSACFPAPAWRARASSIYWLPARCGRMNGVFSNLVTNRWLPSVLDARVDDSVRVVVDPSLPESRSVALLRLEAGPMLLSLTPARASELALADGERIDDLSLRSVLDRAGLTLNSPDHLFYLTLDEQATLRGEALGDRTRQLTAADAHAFEELVAAAPDEDLEEAFVELDHWLVFGAFVGDKLASVVSMYPWNGTRLADLGVLTLPEFRGRGLGRETVRAAIAAAMSLGYEPQYRCQVDNVESVALARAAGFTPFGLWEVIIDEE
ncbi:GNAT family N-acetyltransferase [Pseudoclavibacter sp. AY1F1]|nr:GNAT family N-acetyltransferase [Pseudoclavibacter sp. AY1F1]